MRGTIIGRYKEQYCTTNYIAASDPEYVDESKPLYRREESACQVRRRRPKGHTTTHISGE